MYGRSKTWYNVLKHCYDKDEKNKVMSIVRRLCRYKRGNQNPYIEDEQTTQWPKKKDKLKDKQRSTKHTHKTKDQVIQTTCTENRGMNSGTPEG